MDKLKILYLMDMESYTNNHVKIKIYLFMKESLKMENFRVGE